MNAATRIFRWGAPVVAGAAFLFAPPSARAQGGAAMGQAEQLASLTQDVQLLSRQVSQLNLTVEALRQSNADLQKQLAAQSSVAGAVAASRNDAHTELTQSNAALRKEIVDTVTKQMDALAKDTNAKFDALRAAIQAAPVRGAAGGGGGETKNFTTDFPQTGIKYTIKPNDNLSKIAQANNSTVEWIQSANKITNPNGLRAGQVIFVPQKSGAPASAPSVQAVPLPAAGGASTG